MPFVIYGIGANTYYFLNRYFVDQNDIAAFIDRDPRPERLPEEYRKIRCYSWEEWLEQSESEIEGFVIGSSNYIDEIREMITKTDKYKNTVISDIRTWITNRGYKTKVITDQFASIIKRIEPIKSECLLNSRIVSDRIDALKLLPINGVCAEVGVAAGGFTHRILEIMQPQKLYAVDVFSNAMIGYEDICFGDLGHYNWYKKEFEKEIMSGVLQMVRGISWEVLEKFPDDYFDYVYLDAAHDYDSVKKDVCVLEKKVKNGGIIAFNDYILFDYYMNCVYGTKAVINELVNRTNSEVLYYCLSANGFDDIIIKLNK